MKAKKLFCLLLTAVFLLSLPISAGALNIIAALNPDNIPTPRSEFVAVLCADNMQTIFGTNVDTKIAPASTAKMMTAIVAYEKLKEKNSSSGSANFLDTIHISSTKNAISNLPAVNYIGIKEEEVLTAYELLNAILISNANDAANVLAEYVGGTIQDFVKLMNEKAKEIGAVNTNFVNPTGIDNDEMYTTVEDTAKIAATFYKINELSTISKTDKYIMRSTNKTSSQRNLLNKNPLVSKYTTTEYFNADAIGLNAGSTAKGGYCVAAAVENEGIAYIVTVMNGKEENEKILPYLDVTDLIKWTKEHLGYVSLLSKSKIIDEIQVKNGNSLEHVTVRPKENVEYIADKGVSIQEDVSYKTEYFQEELEAPIEAGAVVGKIHVLINNQIVASVDLITMNAVERNELLFLMNKVTDFIQGKTFRNIIIGIVVLIILYFILSISLRIYRFTKEKKRKQERIARRQALQQNRDSAAKQQNSIQQNKIDVRKSFLEDDDFNIDDDDDENSKYEDEDDY